MTNELNDSLSCLSDRALVVLLHHVDTRHSEFKQLESVTKSKNRQKLIEFEITERMNIYHAVNAEVIRRNIDLDNLTISKEI